MCGNIIDKVVSFRLTDDTVQHAGNQVYNYKFAQGVYYLESRYAIHEGDGERVLRCWNTF